MKFQYNDGGRKDAGYKGTTSDCVVRAVATATGRPYQEIYNEVNTLSEKENFTKYRKTKSSARTGVRKATTRRYLKSLGWKWTPTMFIGSGCKVHMKASELPKGVLIAKLSKHITTIINGVINDTYDCSRDETRCVYGYYKLIK